VRDVLLSGATLIFRDKLEKSERLRAIRTSNFRIGRASHFLPQRITRALRSAREYHPLWMSVHVNHPRELTIE